MAGCLACLDSDDDAMMRGFMPAKKPLIVACLCKKAQCSVPNTPWGFWRIGTVVPFALPMRCTTVALAVVTLLTTTSIGCIAGVGATAGMTVDSGGNMALVARGWYRSGSRLNKEKSKDKTAEWGMPVMPQIELGAGYDISRRGLRLEFGMPFIGVVRAPLDESGKVVDAHVGFRGALTLLDGQKDTYFTGHFYTSFSLSAVLSFDKNGSKRSDWDGPRTYHTLGGRIEPGFGFGDAWFSIYAGPSFERLMFYNIYLSEGPDDGNEEPPPPP
jgi:hypothetical protein